MLGVAIDVTDRQIAQQKLAASISLLQAALESTTDGILVVDSQGGIVTYNRKMGELWRIPDDVLATARDERAIGFVLDQLVDPEAFLERVRQLYSTPEAESFDVIEFTDGRVFERYSQPQRVGSGVVGRVWSFRDVTHRRRAEDELRRREAQLARTQELAGLGSWEYEIGTDHVSWSDELYRIYGLEPQSVRITLQGFLERVHPEDRERVAGVVQQSLGSGEPFSFEHRILRPDGSVRWIVGLGEVIADAAGQPRSLHGTGQDITARKAASEALRVSENRFRAMFEQFPFSIQIFSPEGQTLDVNRAWSDFFGLSREDVAEFNPLSAEQLSEIAPYFERAFAGQRTVVPPTLFDRRGAAPADSDGAVAARWDKPRWVEAFMCPVTEQDGSVREVFVVHQDVTSEREAEEILRRSNEELEHAVDARTSELAEANTALEQEVAERERAEDELRAKTSQLEALFRALPDSYVRLSNDGKVLETRAGSEAHLCCWPEAWIGKHLEEVLPPAAAGDFRAAMAEMRAVGRARVEYVALVDGRERDLEARLVPLSSDEAITIVRDISDRKSAERALKKREEHFRLLIENSSDVASIVGPDGTNWYQSPAVTGVLGYLPDELVGTRAFELIHPDDLAHARTALEQAARNPGSSVAVEFRYKHKDGSWRYLESRAKTLLPDSAEGGVVVNSRDVSDRHQAELALQKREEHFRRLIENGSDLIQIVTPELTIRYTSPSVERVLGFSPLQVFGMHLEEVIHPEDLAGVEEVQKEILATPGTTRSAEYRVRHADGSWRVFEGVARTVSPITGDEGLVVNARDITERKAFEEALRRAIAEAEAARETAEDANRAKSEFLSRMSHELRTPLNSILGFAQVIARREIPPDQRKAVDHILKAGRHLLNLINEVLDIARIEANHQLLSLEPVEVEAVVQEALNLIHPMAAERGCRVAPVCFDHDWYVRADRQRLTQVLLNLLSNAVKYNRPGGTVSLSCEEVDGALHGVRLLRLCVTDNGHGIPAHRMQDLFTPFARLGAEETGVEGTGLGLALSQRLVHAMYGTLSARSVVGEGSTFSVELPIVSSPLDDWAGTAGAEGLERRAPRAERSASLLYIEDNLANLELIETVLDLRPEVTLFSALQGHLGVRMARKHRPDLILLDLHLPDIPGVEVLRRLRDDPRTRTIPVIVVSADATPSTIQRFKAQGAYGYLTKPIDVDQLLESVDRILAARAPLQ
jgi:PAS domain S-box-containing protein